MADGSINSGTVAQQVDAALARVGVAASAPANDRVQAHGGALRTGNPGNKGGGRPKESLRRRMRRLLGKSLELLERDLNAQLDGTEPVLASSSVGPAGPQKGPLTRAEVQKTAELAAKYGVGKEDKREVETTSVRYVIRLPAKPAKPASVGPVVVVSAPALLPPVEQTACDIGKGAAGRTEVGE